MKKFIPIIFIFATYIGFSQSERAPITGKISDKFGILPNVHVINKNTNLATFSNSNGLFSINAAINDSIQFTFVGYDTKIITVVKAYLNSDLITPFFLEKINYALDEVTIAKNNLRGSLSSDVNQTPVDKKKEALAKTMDFSEVNMKVIQDDDHIDTKVRPPVVISDPTQRFVGVGSSATIPMGGSKRLWALRKELALRKGMPEKLMSEYGEKFFFEELQIPPERYFHFLEYCNPLGIEKMYVNGNSLELIKTLRKEHVPYLELISKEK